MVDVAIRYGWSLGTGEVLIIRNLEWGRGGYSVLTKIYPNISLKELNNLYVIRW